MKFDEKLKSKIKGLSSGICRLGEYAIHYVEAGAGQPVILLHGANIGWAEWYKNIEALAKNFKIFAIDLPGAGLSTRVDFSTIDADKTFVDVVENFIKFKRLEKVDLVGHSVGGWVVMKLAINRPELVRKLVLVNSLGFSDYVPWGYRPISFRFGANLLSKTVMSPTRDNMRKFLADVLYNKSELSEDLVDYYFEAVNFSHPSSAGQISHPFMMINRLFKPLKIRDEFVLKDELGKIAAPTQVIVSDKDPLLLMSKQRAGYSLIPNAELKVFNDVGHVPPIERSIEFNEVVINFLNKEWAR